ncbi:uncharacterized protein [Penaeus vannamei]|uniref:uncharacterized protein n=1 Tax=Penaeus vannamei TaxID=6689 RepID=UPI000F663A35|nr:uncharacterized protein LOC113826407 [Penaeus vannamei]
MALPKKFTVGPVFSQEADYGSEKGMLRRAPTTTTAHPLEESERMFDKHQEEQKMRSARSQFGIGFVAHMQHERAAASCPTIGHLGFLPRSNAHSQALTGRDLLCDFNDTLGLEPEITTTPHSVMEKLQLKSNFRV